MSKFQLFLPKTAADATGSLPHPFFNWMNHFAVVVLLASCVVDVRAVFAEVARMEIDQRVPFAEGHRFGATGAYEVIRGRFYFESDPNHAGNAKIADLSLAPRNNQGAVEHWSDFLMLCPADPTRGNRRILYDVTNRGNLLSLWTFNEGERTNAPLNLEHAGNGFLLDHGYTLLWSGWNGDVQEDGTNRLRVGLPIAEEAGKPIRGKTLLEISVDEPQRSWTFGWSPWGVAAAYPTIDVNDSDATLTKRPHRSEPAVVVPRDQWRFARWEPSDDGQSGRMVEDPQSLFVQGGLQSGWLYELTYTTEKPRVAGLGMSGIRDAVSFLRYATEDQNGAPNPLAGAVDFAYLFGISQSGRLVNHFIYDAFHVDLEDRPVFEGAIAMVPGSGRGQFNQRFGLKTLYSTQHRDHLVGSEMFPFTTVRQQDPVTGQQGDLLQNSRSIGQVPKIFYVQSSTEYWSRAASLLHTDVQGQTDAAVDPNARIYLISSSAHLGAQPPTPGIGQTPRNPLRHRAPVLRALLIAMDRWVSSGVEPPPSRYPRIDDETLVSVDQFNKAFPSIPEVNVPQVHYTPFRLDFGPRWQAEGIVDYVPPKMGPPFQSLVPQVDGDGNEIAGIRLPEIAVPVATHAGWSLRRSEVGAEGMLANLDGSFFPFPITAQQRQATADPRPAVLQRYPTRAHYLSRFTEATLTLHAEGYLLAEDAMQMIQQAAERDF